jgi:hypothetical protein
MVSLNDALVISLPSMSVPLIRGTGTFFRALKRAPTPDVANGFPTGEPVGQGSYAGLDDGRTKKVRFPSAYISVICGQITHERRGGRFPREGAEGGDAASSP